MKINPRQLEKIAKQMGMTTKEIEAEEVIIRTPDREIVITEPSVSKMNMMGQETFQISGVVHERDREPFSNDDIKTVMGQTGASEDDVRRTLNETLGDLAKSILVLKKKQER